MGHVGSISKDIELSRLRQHENCSTDLSTCRSEQNHLKDFNTTLNDVLQFINNGNQNQVNVDNLAEQYRKLKDKVQELEGQNTTKDEQIEDLIREVKELKGNLTEINTKLDGIEGHTPQEQVTFILKRDAKCQLELKQEIKLLGTCNSRNIECEQHTTALKRLTNETNIVQALTIVETYAGILEKYELEIGKCTSLAG